MQVSQDQKSSGPGAARLNPCEVDFASPPPLGWRLEVPLAGRMQFYELVALERYIRRSDGQPSALLTWASRCAACGEVFTITSGLRGNSLNRRCKAHRAPGARS